MVLQYLYQWSPNNILAFIFAFLLAVYATDFINWLIGRGGRKIGRPR